MATNEDGVTSPLKSERLGMAVELLRHEPRASNGLMAYKQLARALNEIEDRYLGDQHWAPPKSFFGGLKTARMYPAYPETFIEVEGFLGVTQFRHIGHVVFISRYGAIQIYERSTIANLMPPYTAAALLDKLDIYGDQAWHEKNRD